MSFCTVHDFPCGTDQPSAVRMSFKSVCWEGSLHVFTVRGGTTENRFPPKIRKILCAKDTSQQSSTGESLNQQVQVFRESQHTPEVSVPLCHLRWQHEPLRPIRCAQCLLVPFVQPCRPRMRRSTHAADIPDIYLSRVSARRTDSTTLSRGLSSEEVVIVWCGKAAMRWLRKHCGTGLRAVC